MLKSDVTVVAMLLLWSKSVVATLMLILCNNVVVEVVTKLLLLFSSNSDAIVVVVIVVVVNASDASLYQISDSKNFGKLNNTEKTKTGIKYFATRFRIAFALFRF